MGNGDVPPLVSIVMPTYNREKTIGPAISSAIGQTFKDWELIIVDDGSTDGTKGVIDSFDEPRIRYFRHEENRGMSAALNTGIKLSSGKYIALLDDDNIWRADKLEKQIRIMDARNMDYGMVYCGEVRKGPGGKDFYHKPRARGAIYKKQLAYDRTAGSNTWLVRKQVFDDERVGLFDEEIPARLDYDMSLKISRYYKIDYVDEGLVEVLYIDIPHRLSDSGSKVLAGELMIKERVEKQIADFPFYEKRRILSGQNFYIGFDRLTVAKDRSGIRRIVEAFWLWPFNLRAILCIFLYVLGDRDLSLYGRLHISLGRLIHP